MGTYLNCYEILTNVRIALGEYTELLVQGGNQPGYLPNSYLLNQINNAQRYIWSVLFKDFQEQFLTSASLTVAASAATLPADCFKIKRYEDDNGNKIEPMTVDSKHIEDETASQYHYYRYGNTLRIDEDGLSGAYTLWYYTRPRDITCGMSSAGGAKSLTLATSARKEADYYNNMKIENVTDDWVDTISDYSAARVCTISTETGAASKYYGLISELPEIFHSLIAERAILMVRPHAKDPIRITPQDIQIFNDNFNEMLAAYAGMAQGDVTPNDTFAAFEAIL